MEFGNSRGESGNGIGEAELGEAEDEWPGNLPVMRFTREPDELEWDELRAERIFQQVVLKVEQRRARRRLVRTFAAGVSLVVLAVGVLLRWVGLEARWSARPGVILADKAAGDRTLR